MSRLAESSDPSQVRSFVNALEETSDVRRVVDEKINLDQLAIHYDELSSQKLRQQFIDYVEDDKLGPSWIDVVSNERINTDAVETAIRRADRLPEGDDINKFRTARDVNAEYKKSIEDPYASNSIVIEYETNSQQVFSRVHGEDNQARAWMFRDESQITGLAKSEIKNLFSLPEEPLYVSEVHVSKGTEIRTGTVAANFGGRRGATQFELLEKLPAGKFKNKRPLPIEDD